MTGSTSHDPEAERAILGALLRNARRVLELVAVEPREFFDPRHAKIAQAIAGLLAESKPVDEIAVADRLGEWLEKCGGYSMLAELASGYATAENVAHYVGIMRDHALKRRVSVACGEIARVANNQHDSGEDAHAELLRQASAVEGPEQQDSAQTLAEVLSDNIARISAVLRGEEPKVRSVLTGYADLDDLAGGMARGAVTIIAGRPSQGKSALARRIALNAAQGTHGHAGEGVHVFSLEDARDRYGDRTLADLANVNLARFSERRPGFTSAEFEAIRGAQRAVEGLPLVIDDSAGLSSQQIATRVRMRKRALHTTLVVVDYVQLMRERGATKKLEEVDRAVEGLVRLAREEDVAVLLLSQLSRDSEKRDDKRPLLSDLRESGTLEQAAYAVWIVHQEWLYLNPESKNPEVRAAYQKAHNVGEVLVRKNKNGARGDARLRWNPTTATYADLAWKDRY